MKKLNKYHIDLYIIAFSIGLYIASKDEKLTIAYLIGYSIYRFGNFIEKKVMDNLNLLIFLLIYFLFIYKDEVNENITLLTFIGGIIVFWYGYKKYERDKELEIIEKYSKEYNENKNDYVKLLSLWEKEFFLKEKGYISKELWEEWNYWIDIDITESIVKDSESIIDIYISNYDTYNHNFSKDNNFTNYINNIFENTVKDNKILIKDNIKIQNLIKKYNIRFNKSITP